jgi:hypothetical protein
MLNAWRFQHRLTRFDAAPTLCRFGCTPVYERRSMQTAAGVLGIQADYDGLGNSRAEKSRASDSVKMLLWQ